MSQKMMTKKELLAKKNIFCIGIGGIGLSALARILKRKGAEVSGSDRAESVVIESLRAEGISARLGCHQAKNLPKGADLIIKTVAVSDDNPEIVKAKSSGIPILSYPEALGIISQDEYLIAVSGSHGKTTTTAMIAGILEEAKFDPTVVVGSNLERYQGNARVGQGEYWVIEADEYRGAFWHYFPRIAALTNMEYEHPDFFKDLPAYQEAFVRYLKNLAANGVVVANGEDENVNEALVQAGLDRAQILKYGISGSYALEARMVTLQEGKPSFDFHKGGAKVGRIELNVLGKHNVYNALAALGVGVKLGIEFKIMAKALSEFGGTWRRMEYLGEFQGADFYDDYGHHPTEVQVTLEALRDKYPRRRLVCLFQPHLKKRLAELMPEFAAMLSLADVVILADIYKVEGREEEIEVDVGDLAEMITGKGVEAYYAGDLKRAAKFLAGKIESGDVVVTMGAGDVTSVGREFFKES